jgi:hypothetical protein
MDIWNTHSPHSWITMAESNPTPANENLKLLPDWMTAAEVLQWVGREQEQMRRELAADFRLRYDRKHRLDWENLEALRRCVQQHCYGQC